MNYQEVYQQRLGAMTESILGNKIKEEIEIKSIGDAKLTRLYEDMEQITGKPVYEDFNYRCGKVLGVLKHIAQNSKFSKQLYELTGLNRGYIDIYYSACGQLPYVKLVRIAQSLDCLFVAIKTELFRYFTIPSTIFADTICCTLYILKDTLLFSEGFNS